MTAVRLSNALRSHNDDNATHSDYNTFASHSTNAKQPMSAHILCVGASILCIIMLCLYACVLCVCVQHVQQEYQFLYAPAATAALYWL